MTTLQKTFIALLTRYTDDNSLINNLWAEVVKNYSGKKRYYHNMVHLEQLLTQLTRIKDDVQDWDTLLCTLYYHDIIYNPLRSNNEEKSAELAEKRLRQLDISDASIARCISQVLATKSHRQSIDRDTNYFTDADLSIMGQSWQVYASYYHNVRKEYALYPNLVYNSGRKKVLRHFLAMDKIFKTDFFYNTFEAQARRNLKREMGLL